MAGFCEIKLAQPLDNSLLGEHLPSRRVFLDYSQNPDQDIRLSVLYGRIDQDIFTRVDEKWTRERNIRRRIIRTTKNSKKKININNSVHSNRCYDYNPNYYAQDLITTSENTFNSLQEHRDNILPFSENKEENIKKLKTFNVTENNARFSSFYSRTYGQDGSVYFNGPEPNLFNDINFTKLTDQVLSDPFYFISKKSTKIFTNMDYPYYVNDYHINKLGSSICPFNVIDEIQLNHSTLINIKGLTVRAELSREKTPESIDFEQIALNTRGIFQRSAPYGDEGIPDVLVNSSQNIKLTFRSYFNAEGKEVFKLESEQKFPTTSFYENYIEQPKNIPPFNDSILHSYNEGDSLEDDTLYFPAGKFINYEHSNGLESISFIDLMD